MSLTILKWSEVKPADFQALQSVLKGYIPQDQTLPEADAPSLSEETCTDGTQYLGMPTDYDGNYKKYFSLDTVQLRKKFIQLSGTTLFTQTLGGVAVMIYELFHAMTLSFCLSRRFSSLGQRILTSGFLLLHILSIPIALIGMFCIAIYGIARPQSARPCYAKLEGWVYIRTGMYETTVCCRRKPFFSVLTLPFYPVPVIQRYIHK